MHALAANELDQNCLYKKTNYSSAKKLANLFWKRGFKNNQDIFTILRLYPLADSSDLNLNNFEVLLPTCHNVS